MTARPIRYQRQVSDRNGKIFYTSIASLSHINKIGGDVSKGMEGVSEEDGGHAGGAVVRCAAESSGAAQPRLPKK